MKFVGFELARDHRCEAAGAFLLRVMAQLVQSGGRDDRIAIGLNHQILNSPAHSQAPAPTRSGHIEESSLRKQRTKAFDVVAKEATKNNQAHSPIRALFLAAYFPDAPG